MAFYSGLMVAEIDLEGNILNMSKKMARFYGINPDNAEGTQFATLIAQDDAEREAYMDEFWTALIANGKASREQNADIRGKDIYATEHYKVIYKDDMPYRVIVIAISKMREKELNERLQVEIQSYIDEHGGKA